MGYIEQPLAGDSLMGSSMHTTNIGRCIFM